LSRADNINLRCIRSRFFLPELRILFPEILIGTKDVSDKSSRKQDRQCACNVTLRSTCGNVVVVLNHKVLLSPVGRVAQSV
jgi:hypothetical protein